MKVYSIETDLIEDRLILNLFINYLISEGISFSIYYNHYKTPYLYIQDIQENFDELVKSYMNRYNIKIGVHTMRKIKKK